MHTYIYIYTSTIYDIREKNRKLKTDTKQKENKKKSNGSIFERVSLNGSKCLYQNLTQVHTLLYTKLYICVTVCIVDL